MIGSVLIIVAALTAELGCAAMAVSPGLRLVSRRCTSCHLVPEPAVLQEMTVDRWEAVHGGQNAPVSESEMQLIRDQIIIAICLHIS